MVILMSDDTGKQFNFPPEVMAQWRGKKHFLEGENGILIILIHGWTRPPRQMLPLAKILNGFGYSVSLPLLSGHGSVPEDLEGVVWSDWVKDIRQEIEKQRRKKKYRKIIVGGSSLGGTISLLVSLVMDVDGLILIGTPVHFKNHLSIKLSSLIMPFFKRYIKKRTPKNIKIDPSSGYQYMPTKNVREVLLAVRKSVFNLKKVKAPVIILQNREDFFVAKYSPWIIYKNVSSEIKKIVWIDSKSENHIPQDKENRLIAKAINDFFKKIFVSKS